MAIGTYIIVSLLLICGVIILLCLDGIAFEVKEPRQPNKPAKKKKTSSPMKRTPGTRSSPRKAAKGDTEKAAVLSLGENVNESLFVLLFMFITKLKTKFKRLFWHKFLSQN